MCGVASRIRDALEAPRCSGLGLGLRTVPLVEVALHGLHQIGGGVKVGLAVPWHRCRPHRPTDRPTDRWVGVSIGIGFQTRADERARCWRARASLRCAHIPSLRTSLQRCRILLSSSALGEARVRDYAQPAAASRAV